MGEEINTAGPLWMGRLFMGLSEMSGFVRDVRERGDFKFWACAVSF